MKAIGVCAVIALLGLLIYNRPWEPHVSAGTVEQYLLAEFPDSMRSADCHTEWHFGDPKEQGLQLDDWDYTCTVTYRSGDEAVYWAASDWHRVTETARSGP